MRRLPKTDSNLSNEKIQARRVLAGVVPYIWPEDKPWVKRRVVLALLALFLAKLIAVATPWFFKTAVDILAGDEPASDWLLPLGAIGATIAYGLARLMTVGFQQLRDVIFARVGQGALRDIAKQTFSHIHALSMRYHIMRKTGGLSRIIERGVKGVEFLLRFLIFSIGPLLLELLMISVVLAFAFSVKYLVVVFLTIAAYVAFTFMVTEWRVRIRKEMNAQDTDANQKAIDSLLNFETVKYFGAERWETERYDAAMARYEQAALKTNYTLAFLNFGQSLIITSGLVAVMIMAAMGVQDGTLSVGDFVMVNAYMIQITMPLNFLGTIYREIRQALIDMGEMFDLLAVVPEVQDAPGAIALSHVKGAVRFDQVGFSYDEASPLLKDVSFEIPAGGSLAIVGASGSGKSTIGRLLFRFYDVSSGAVEIDGHDVRNVTQESLHAQIGVVPQDTVLFNDTVYYNIAYGRPDATQADVIAAAKAANIHEFISGLKDGYQTQVGERGLKLSGGEKQRVGIARTILKNPPILLLDEATSALDTHTEQRIMESLRGLGHGRTVVMIAHRLSTVVDADQILVLDQGKVIEKGAHGELLAQNGRYAQMWAVQQAEEEAA